MGGEQFLRSAASENSKFLRWIRFSCRGISLLERGRTVSPPGYMNMNAKDFAFRVIETLNRFFDTVEIIEEAICM